MNFTVFATSKKLRCQTAADNRRREESNKSAAQLHIIHRERLHRCTRYCSTSTRLIGLTVPLKSTTSPGVVSCYRACIISVFWSSILSFFLCLNLLVVFQQRKMKISSSSLWIIRGCKTDGGFTSAIDQQTVQSQQTEGWLEETAREPHWFISQYFSFSLNQQFW